MKYHAEVAFVEVDSYGENVTRQDGSAVSYVAFVLGEGVQRATLPPGLDPASVPLYERVVATFDIAKRQDGKLRWRLDEFHQSSEIRIRAAAA